MNKTYLLLTTIVIPWTILLLLYLSWDYIRFMWWPYSTSQVFMVGAVVGVLLWLLLKAEFRYLMKILGLFR